MSGSTVRIGFDSSRQPQLRVTRFPHIPDAAGDKYVGLSDFVKKTFEQVHPGNLLLHPIDRGQNLYDPHTLRELLTTADPLKGADLVEVDAMMLSWLVAENLIDSWDSHFGICFHPEAVGASRCNDVIFLFPTWLCASFQFTRVAYSEHLHAVLHSNALGAPLRIERLDGSNSGLCVDGYVMRRGLDRATRRLAEQFACHMNRVEILTAIMRSRDAPDGSTPRYLLAANEKVYEHPDVRADEFYMRFHELIRVR